MSEVSFEEQDDSAFEAEFNEAREAQDGPVEQDIVTGPEGDAPEEEAAEDEKPPVSKDVEKLERIAADKSRAFRAERRQRQDAEARANALEARLAALEGKRISSDPFDLSGLPDVDTDPLGNLEALRRVAEQLASQRREEDNRTKQQTAQERQFNQINTRMQEYESDFKEQNPDYDDAAKHFREKRMEELAEQGYEGDELTSALRTELVGLVARTLHAGKDPAEVVYKLARNRGFGGELRKEVVDTASKKLQTIERGQKAGRSLTTMGGKTGDGGLSVDAVTKLDGAAFDQAFARLRAEARRAG